MRGKKFVFVGNRYHVLDELINRGLTIVAIFCVKDSYLEKELIRRKLPHKYLINKKIFLEELDNISFDFLISNGLPYRLPISKLQQANPARVFINIHPSFLPDLRGADPIPGSILMKRDSGATCHIMNDGIDEGDIIEQICLPYNEFWDAVILYQITFVLERFVFIKSLEAKFKPKTKQQIQSDSVYYTFNESDRKIDFYRNSIDTVRAKVKAFNNKSKGPFFEYHGSIFKVYDCEIVNDNSMIQLMKSIFSFEERRVIVVAENQIVMVFKNKLINLKNIVGDLSLIKVGDIL